MLPEPPVDPAAPASASTSAALPAGGADTPEAPKRSAAEPKLGRRRSLEGEDPAWADAVMQSVLLRKLSVAELKYVKGALKAIHVASGDVVYSQGSFTTDESMYLVKSGRFMASEHIPGSPEGSPGRDLREYSRSAAFGSHELLYGAPRSSTITCVEAGTLWTINRRVFDAKLKAPPASSDPLEQKALLERIQQAPLFAEARLSTAQLQQLARAAVEKEFRTGEQLCQKGDEATSVFVVVEGACVARNEPDDPAEFAFELRAPACFGESAFSFDKTLRTRAASVFAHDESGCTILSFAVSAIEAVLGFVLTKRSLHAFSRKLLAAIRIGKPGTPMLDGLSEEQVDQLLDSMYEEAVPPGGVIADAGSTPHALQMVKRGELVVAGADKSPISTLRVGDFFGETSLASRTKVRPRKTSVTASGDETVVILTLPAASIKADSAFDAWRDRLLPPKPEPAAKPTKDGKAKRPSSAPDLKPLTTPKTGTAATVAPAKPSSRLAISTERSETGGSKRAAPANTPKVKQLPVPPTPQGKRAGTPPLSSRRALRGRGSIISSSSSTSGSGSASSISSRAASGPHHAGGGAS
jgi:CRP-like cAMP-binding protein